MSNDKTVGEELTERLDRFTQQLVAGGINVGDWTVTRERIDRLEDLSLYAEDTRRATERRCRECCQLLGIDPTTDSVAKDIAEEIVLHGTPPMEAIAKLQKHLEQSNEQD